MFAEVPVALSVSDVLATDIAHLVATDTGEFVASRGLDEGRIAARTCSFDSQRHGEFDLCAKSHERRLVTYMNVIPCFGA